MAAPFLIFKQIERRPHGFRGQRDLPLSDTSANVGVRDIAGNSQRKRRQLFRLPKLAFAQSPKQGDENVVQQVAGGLAIPNTGAEEGEDTRRKVMKNLGLGDRVARKNP